MRSIFFLIMIFTLSCYSNEHAILDNYDISFLISRYDKTFYRSAGHVFDDITLKELERCCLSKKTKSKLYVLQERIYKVFEQCIKELALEKCFFSTQASLEKILEYLSFTNSEKNTSIFSEYLVINKFLFCEILAKAKNDADLLFALLEAREDSHALSCAAFMRTLAHFIASFYDVRILEKRLRASSSPVYDCLCSVPQVYIGIEKVRNGVMLKTLPTGKQIGCKDVWYKKRGF